MGAVLPTQKFASDIMASEINSNSNLVVELGAGTGQITNSILNKKINEKDLILVEINKEFSEILKKSFQKLRFIQKKLFHFLRNFLRGLIKK